MSSDVGKHINVDLCSYLDTALAFIAVSKPAFARDVLDRNTARPQTTASSLPQPRSQSRPGSEGALSDRAPSLPFLALLGSAGEVTLSTTIWAGN